MDLLITVAGFCVALFILVSVHEFGHFYVARRCGVKVLRFCIGMGKPLISFRDRHGTEFGLAPLPLGGYVKMLDERETEVLPADRHLAYNYKTPWQRIAILAAGPTANFILALVVFWGMAAVMGSTGLTPNVGSVTPDSPAALAGLAPGQRIVAVDGEPTATRQAVFERLLGRLGETGELTLTVAEGDLERTLTVPLQGWLRGTVDPMPTQGLGFDFYSPAVLVSEVQEGSAAASAGLAAGDIIRAVDGEPTPSLNRWIDYIKARPDTPIELTVEREGELLDLSVTPRTTVLPDGTSAGQVGVMAGPSQFPEDMIVRENFGPLGIVVQGFEKTWDTTGFVLMSMKKLILGEISTKNLSGPIGIAKVAGDQARAGLPYFIEFLAILSIYLGVLNLLPIPILDGGHIVYCLVEAVKGSPVSERIQMFGFSAGLALLGCVMVVAFYNDILRL